MVPEGPTCHVYLAGVTPAITTVNDSVYQNPRKISPLKPHSILNWTVVEPPPKYSPEQLRRAPSAAANSGECRRMRYGWLRRARGSSGDSYAHQEAFCMLREAHDRRSQAPCHDFRRCAARKNAGFLAIETSPSRFNPPGDPRCWGRALGITSELRAASNAGDGTWPELRVLVRCAQRKNGCGERRKLGASSLSVVAKLLIGTEIGGVHRVHRRGRRWIMRRRLGHVGASVREEDDDPKG
jgi:hypothetical protein